MRNLLAVFLLVLPLSLCKAQTAPVKPVEPTAIGVIYRLEPSTQELKRLPDEQWKEKHGNRSESDLYVEVSGTASSFRIKADAKFEFLFSTGSPEKVALYRFDQKKKLRVFAFQKQESLLHTAVTPLKGLPVDVSKYGESSFKLVPASPLTPGEYVIMIGGEAYTFGVDQ
jgi:hypothetical protein